MTVAGDWIPGGKNHAIDLPKECAAVVLELKNLPRPRSPNLTTPAAVMNTLAGLISEAHQTPTCYVPVVSHYYEC